MSTTTTDTPRRRLPQFRRAETPPAFQITERDIEIVRQVARHRFLRSTHISQLVVGSHKKIVDRLKPLFHHGYLDKPRSQRDYHVRGGGNAAAIYALGSRGAELLNERDGFQRGRIDWAEKNRDAGREFILHTLAIADVRVALSAACKAAAIGLQEAEEMLPTLPEQTQLARNPWALRVPVQFNGALKEIGVVPDHVFMLQLSDGRRRAFLVECDKGTMPVERSTLDQTSMLRKFLAYEGARKQAVHTRHFGWKNFRVLIVAPSLERSAHMRQVIAQTPELKASPLFLFAVHDDALLADILNAQWRAPDGSAHGLA